MKDYFWLLALIYMPGAAITAALVSPLHCLISQRLSATWMRVAASALALALSVVGTLTLGPLVLGEPIGSLSSSLGGVWSSALFPFGILLPWGSATAYIYWSPRPIWWKAALVGVAATLIGAVLWAIAGTAVGAETD